MISGRPLRELGEAMIDVMTYTYNEMRQPLIQPCGICMKGDRQWVCSSPLMLWLKGLFLSEPSPAPAKAGRFESERFDRLRACAITLRRKYAEARLHVLYGVVVEEGLQHEFDGNSQEDPVTDPVDQPSVVRLSRFVSVDQEVFTDHEYVHRLSMCVIFYLLIRSRLGFMNIFARGAFILQLSTVTEAMEKMKRVALMPCDNAAKRELLWKTLRSLWQVRQIPNAACAGMTCVVSFRAGTFSPSNVSIGLL